MREQTQRKYGHPKSRDQDDSAYSSKAFTVDIEIKQLWISSSEVRTFVCEFWDQAMIYADLQIN